MEHIFFQTTNINFTRGGRYFDIKTEEERLYYCSNTVLNRGSGSRKYYTYTAVENIMHVDDLFADRRAHIYQLSGNDCEQSIL